ncbi:porin family protein [Sphingomonas humi]|uniref:Outer membrane protein beta-barrel domain-containing protein n=1 Tax=Sphingomonas humi TaxID=335630 RepID=A0ABP7SCE7_9SPHN
MKTAHLIAAVALVAGVAVPAQAQDAPSHTGPRAEVRFAYDFVGATLRTTINPQNRGTFAGDDASDEGTNIGGEVGYDVQAGPAVVGIYAGAEKGSTQVNAISRPYALKTGMNWTVGARAGVVSRDVLIYVKAGYSNGELRGLLLPTASPTFFSAYDSKRNGWHAGAGAEFPIAGGVYGKLEYVHHKYDTATVSTTEELRFSRNQLVAGVGYRF